MIRKAVLVTAGAIVLAGSSYGGYRVVGEQTDRNEAGVQAETPSQAREEVGKQSPGEAPGNRPDGAGAPVGEVGERADVMGRVSAVGDGYMDVVTFGDPGSGAGQGAADGAAHGGNRASGVPGAMPMPEDGETVRIVLVADTAYFLASGGPETEQSDAAFSDIGEGDAVSVWLAESDDDTMKTAERIVVREGMSSAGNR